MTINERTKIAVFLKKTKKLFYIIRAKTTSTVITMTTTTNKPNNSLLLVFIFFQIFIVFIFQILKCHIHESHVFENLR